MKIVAVSPRCSLWSAQRDSPRPLLVRAPLSVSRNMVVVTTTADVVNGDVSSTVGAEGEAGTGRDLASRGAAGCRQDRRLGDRVHHVQRPLNGKTIEVRSELPPIHRDHLVLEGIAPNGVAREGHARRTACADGTAGGAVAGSGIRGHRSLASLHRRGSEAQSQPHQVAAVYVWRTGIAIRASGPPSRSRTCRSSMTCSTTAASTLLRRPSRAVPGCDAVWSGPRHRWREYAHQRDHDRAEHVPALQQRRRRRVGGLAAATRRAAS